MQRLARHSTIELTIGRYTHAGLFDLSAAVNRLPALPMVDPTPKMGCWNALLIPMLPGCPFGL